MYSITYSLKGNRKKSDPYYDDVSLFTDEVISEAVNFTGPPVE
jgi:hypothetical protein